MGTVPRKLAASFVREQGPSKEEVALAQQQAQNEAMALKQNQQMYDNAPVPYEVQNIMQNASPDEVDEIISGLAQGGGEERQLSDEEMQAIVSRMGGSAGPQGIDMEQQEGAMATGLEGQTPESGGENANPNSMI